MAVSSDIAKPTSGVGLTVEAWSQGYMVGSLIIMAGITVANMRRKVLLHKLILIEVSPGSDVVQKAHLTNQARLRHVSWHFHLSKSASLRMVSFSLSYLPQHLLGHAQRNCMDEEQAILEQEGLLSLHRDSHAERTLLGHRDLRQLHLLQ